MPTELTSVHWQEYLERMKIAQKDVANLLKDHVVYQNNAAIKHYVDAIVTQVDDLYLYVGLNKNGSAL